MLLIQESSMAYRVLQSAGSRSFRGDLHASASQLLVHSFFRFVAVIFARGYRDWPTFLCVCSLATIGTSVYEALETYGARLQRLVVAQGRHITGGKFASTWEKAIDHHCCLGTVFCMQSRENASSKSE